MVQNAAMQALRQAEELKQKLFDENAETIVSTNKTILLTQLQKAYQQVLLIDLDYALDKKVEQDLWNLGFKNQIESLQNSTKDKKNPRRAESQTLLNWCIQVATGFYISLLHQICSAFRLNLPFRCNIPMIDCPQFSKISSRPPQASSCWYICQYCLVHLGDLARYTRQLKMASSFYRQALSVSPSNGQPYNQLGLLKATRGDKLGAAYYHARGLAVGGPFPPAQNNLARTLAQANSVAESTPLSEANPINLSDSSASYARLNPSLFLSHYMSLQHHILTSGDTERAQALVKGMSSTLTALVATQQFQHDTLMQLCCLSMYSVFSLTEGHTLSSETSPMADEEQYWLNLAVDVVAGTMEALLLPVHTTPQSQHITYMALPAIKVLMEWLRLHPEMLRHSSFVSRPQLWPGLCVLLSGLQQCIKEFNGNIYDTIPLPEDVELRGYLPVDKAFSKLKYPNTVSSEMYGNSVVEMKNVLPSDDDAEMSEKEIIGLKKNMGFSISEGETLKKDKNFVDSLRAFRLIQLGKWLVDWQKDNGTEYISISVEDDLNVFTPIQNAVESDPELVKTIQELSILREKRLSECHDQDEQNADDASDNESKSTDATKSNAGLSAVGGLTDRGSGALATIASGDMSPCVEVEVSLSPIIITEADFREKVREKKAGILKPQGSLERARIEKAALTKATVSQRDSPGEFVDTQDNQDTGSSCSTVSQDGNICSDVGSLLEPSVPKEKGKKTRTNVALQAILRKQEESSKQVKFLTPVTTPDSISDPTPQLSPQPSKEPEKKIIQPKIIKSLASLPTDRKTGGILALKDKSGGYPHLQKTETHGETKNEASDVTGEDSSKLDAEKITTTPIKPAGKRDNSGTTNEKSFLPRYTTWSDNIHNRLDDKSASSRLQSQPNFSYFSPPGTTQNMSITLPVVNPKEIDVRSAALQKQKNMYGMGEAFTPTGGYSIDNAVSPYNYWSGLPNPNVQQGVSKNYHRLPPRLANLKRSPNEHQPPRGQDMQFSPQDGGQAGSFAVFNPQGPQHTWWKPTVQEQGYDRAYSSHSIPSPSYQQQNYQQPGLNPMNYPQSGANNSPYQTANFFPQNHTDYSKMMYSSPMLPESPRFGNPGYSNNTFIPPAADSYGPITSYNPEMYPQFSNRFGFAAQPQTKIPGNEYGMNPYRYDNQQYGVANQARLGPDQNVASPLNKSGQTLYPQGSVQTGNQFAAEFDEGKTSPGSRNVSYDAKGRLEGGDGASVYSLFSGSSANVENAWPTTPTTQQNNQQSLWSGPGPSPLERLLEQQKQYKFPPNE